MGVFEDVYAKAKSAADFAGKKTGELVEISRLKINAAELQSKINKEFEAMGLLVYNAAKEHVDCTAQVEKKSAGVDALYAQLAEVNDKIAELKRKKNCAECGFANPEDANFCLKCGAKL